MLINFSIENFRSIKQKKTFDLTASKKFTSEEHIDNTINPESNFYQIETLKSAVLFGGNASGKSNLLKGLDALQKLVTKSNRFDLDEGISLYNSFKLCPESKLKSTCFDIEFIAKNGVRYVYSIEFDNKKFLREELYFYPQTSRGRKTILFKKSLNNKLTFGKYYEGIKKIDVYENQLILSQVSSKPIKSLIAPYRFFSTYLFCSTIHDTRYEDAIIRSFNEFMMDKSKKFKANINKIIRAADTEIQEIIIKEYEEESFDFPEDLPQDIKNDVIERYKYRIKTVHNIFENDKIIGEENFDIKDESTGTIKLLVVGGLILDALQDGSTIIIDELDKSLHPLLTLMLINLFNSKENNPHDAQLIFATHDISLISREIFRLDQIFFSEKDYKGVSNYYRLSEFTNISKLSPIKKWYMLGRFGAIPMINEFELSLDLNEEEYENKQIH